MINGLPRKYLPPYLIGAEAITPRRFLVITQSDLQNLLLDTWAVPNNYRGVRFEGLSRLPTCRLLAQKAWRVRERQGVRGGPNRLEVTRSARPLPHRFERPDRQAPRRRRRRPARARPEPSQRRGDPWARSHRGGYVAGASP